MAIGECGLDYYYDHSPRDVQRDVFAAQIALAATLDLPLVIHTRDAWDDTFDVLDADGVPDRVVFHCFTGGPDEARAGLDRGAYLSFSGIVTFKAATDVQRRRVAVSRRSTAHRDGQSVPRPGAAPRQGQPSGVGPDVGACLADLRGVPMMSTVFHDGRGVTVCVPGVPARHLVLRTANPTHGTRTALLRLDDRDRGRLCWPA